MWCVQYMRKVDPHQAYVAPGAQEMGASRSRPAESSLGPAATHAAPGESINDREKITETKVCCLIAYFDLIISQTKL